MQRILTTEFIHGTKISDVESLKKQGFSLADIDTKLFKAFAAQIFHTGFLHADPHPGNGKETHHCVEAVILSEQKALKMHL